MTIQQSEGEIQATINIAQGKAEATNVNLKVAEKYVEAFAGLARTGNTLIVPSNMADINSLIAGAMSGVKSQTPERAG